MLCKGQCASQFQIRTTANPKHRERIIRPELDANHAVNFSTLRFRKKRAKSSYQILVWRRQYKGNYIRQSQHPEKHKQHYRQHDYNAQAPP